MKIVSYSFHIHADIAKVGHMYTVGLMYTVITPNYEPSFVILPQFAKI